MSMLFSPLKIRGITFKNRIAVSPMCMYSSQDGFANDWHLVHLGSRAVGGAALVITEATSISPEGRISPGDLGIWKDEHISFLRRITEFIENHGSVAGIQLAHAGRKASTKVSWEGGAPLLENEGAWETLAPSSIPFKEGHPVPKTLDKTGIEKVKRDFIDAALRALEAGFKVIEIHAAHGYLLNQFLSPLSNKRTDEYGGSFENRIRLLQEVCENVRSVWPEDYPLLVRISATDWAEGGWTENESVALAKKLKIKGIDLIDCSSGGTVGHVKIPLGPLYQTGFAEKIRRDADIKTGAVGLITTAEEAEGIIKEGRADLVFLAREFLRDPYFPMHAADTLNAELEWPPQYERGKKKELI